MKPSRFLAVFKAKGTNPSLNHCEGWLSISLEANSAGDAERWALARLDLLKPWLKNDLELVHVEAYKPTPEMAGPYRGLVLAL